MLGLHLPADANDLSHARGLIATHVPVVQVPVGGRHQQREVAADGLVGRVAEHVFGSPVEALDQAMLVGDDHRLHQPVEEGEQLLGFCRTAERGRGGHWGRSLGGQLPTGKARQTCRTAGRTVGNQPPKG